MTEQKTISQLPAWFDITKYAPVANFGAEEWHAQIRNRVWLQSSVSGLTRNDAGQDEDAGLTRKAVNLLLAQPTAIQIVEPRPPVAECLDLVRDMTVREVMCLADELRQNDVYVSAWEAYQVELDADDDTLSQEASRFAEDLDDSACEFANRRWPGSGAPVFAEINLSAPIGELVDSFTAWVTKAKANRGSSFSGKKEFNETDFKKWHRYAVMPYFDLQLWANLEKVHIPVWLYVRALFANMEGDTDGMFRKNTRPVAEQVFTQECLDMLGNQS
ncbi:DUF6387 family protein [Caballeronia sp. S22]|uniref:DUF6387 family protein n=1 Tax=Caballeronia sp. S22 TaxID=3137182 RepID=UPI0035317514